MASIHGKLQGPPPVGLHPLAAPPLLTRRKHLAAWVLVLPGMLAWAQGAAPAATNRTIAAKAPDAYRATAPSWRSLSPAQQEALAPLAPVWGEISSNRKRKWIALSANFKSLSAADQATLHGRMKEWASLSNTERNRARLSFAQTRELSHDEKKAQWEAYQSLSPERKKQLAAQAGAPAPGAAPAVTHNPPGKLAAVPTTRSKRAPTVTVARRANAGASAAAASKP